eukprot:TRINITY_DN30348_c0_g1_i1.p1 TRINITY_DN30348_c0_g1~~TRINITY_DN30348_c0_g1_i1.p1  ORF type:complete len:757 (+),score=126.20 TRINITY_DN30348_c0_g1_i1:94-2364(+)
MQKVVFCLLAVACGGQGDVTWEFDTGALDLATPAVWEDKVFSVSSSPGQEGRLVALGENDGVLIWDHILHGSFETLSQPLVYIDAPEDAVLFIPSDEQLFAINASDPYAAVWPSGPSLVKPSKPCLGGELIFVSSEPHGTVHALRVHDGKEMWRVTLGQKVSAPVYIDVTSIVVVVGEGMVYALDAMTGSSYWNISIKGSVTGTSAPMAYPPTSSIFLTTMEDVDGSSDAKKLHMYSISVVGKINWEASGNGSYGLSQPVICQNKMIFTSWTGGGNVTALNMEDGSTIWSALDLHNFANLSEPVCSQALVYVTASTLWSQDIWALSTDDGDFYWSNLVVTPQACSQGCSVKFPPNPPLLDGGSAFIAGIDATVYALPVPTHPVPPPPPHSGSTSVPAYVGYIAAGGGVLVVCLVLSIPKACKKKKPKVATTANNSPESRYVAIRKLGSGSYGTVYEVKCKKDGKLYALKRIPCDNDTERIEAIREWRVLCGIEHPNKITAYETFMNWSNSRTDEEDVNINHMVHRRFVCIVMQYCPEGDLKQYIQSYGRNEKVPESVILSFSGQLCSLLSVLHAQQPPLLHRDLKPENILLDQNHQKILVTDFGLAKSVMTYCKTHAGTLAFIAPETWDRHYSTGADVWAVGCIIYAMITKKVNQDEVRCLWREAGVPNFQSSISDEALSYSYSELLASTIAQLLTPDRRRRPTAVQALQWLRPYVPQYSMRYSSLGNDPQKKGSSSSIPPPVSESQTEDAGSFMS